MRGTGMDPLGGGQFGGAALPGFPAPGNPNSPQAGNSSPAPAASGTTPGAAPAPNMFGSLGDPSSLMQLLGGVGSAGYAPRTSAAPLPDATPPEERFQVQLQARKLTLRVAEID